MSAKLLKIKAQSMLPYYKNIWSEQTDVLRYWLGVASKEFKFACEDEKPLAIRKDGLKLVGMENSPRELGILMKLGKNLDIGGASEYHFRILSDIVVRFYFPHLLPHKYPLNIPNPTDRQVYMEGFHGQHRDCIFHIEDIKLKETFSQVFFPSPDDVIVECGSFIGFGVLAVSALLKSGKIIAIEADDECFEILTMNIFNNRIKNIQPVNAAVWSNSGTQLSFASGGVQANSLISHVVADATTNYKSRPITTKTIDDLVDELGLSKVDMISLTINGAEPEALAGAKNTISNMRPRIRLAGWYELKGQRIAKICEEILIKHNYLVYVGPRNGLMAIPKEKLNQLLN